MIIVFPISNKTRYSTLNGGIVKEKGFPEFQKFWPCLRNFTKYIQVGLLS